MERSPVKYVDELRTAVHEATSWLRAVPEAATGRRPAPGKWCAREILGHLIDSAAHNHQRFVRARWQENLVFPGYDQDAWVLAQDPAAAPWLELLELWRSYNLHLARVMEAVPAGVRLRTTTEHNLDQIGWRPVPRGQPACLDDLMQDYVLHLQHHLGQLRSLLGSAAGPAGR